MKLTWYHWFAKRVYKYVLLFVFFQGVQLFIFLYMIFAEYVSISCEKCVLCLNIKYFGKNNYLHAFNSNQTACINFICFSYDSCKHEKYQTMKN